MAALRLRSLRRTTLLTGALNLAVVSLAPVLLVLVLRRCSVRPKIPVIAAAATAAVRVGWTVGAGISQGLTALAIAGRLIDGASQEDDDDFRRSRRNPITLPSDLIRSPELLLMGDLSVERTATPASNFRSLRWTSMVLGVWNLALVLIGGMLMVSVPPSCSGGQKLPLGVVLLGAGVRILYMVGAAKAQRATAVTILGQAFESAVPVDALVRQERRIRYRRWLWWTRFGMVVTALQFVVALYLIYIIVKDISYDAGSRACIFGQDGEQRGWKQILMISFLVLVWVVVIIQCFTGSDVLRWRSFYATHDTAWKAHYREVFDHGIREALCCMGRVKYLTVLEEDEVYSVARLLGDLVAYRASGTGHLELLAGLALLQKHKQSPKLYTEPIEAPQARIQEAAILHQFAEAAYTGPLLDFGRNPILFPCVWLYRQGVLSPWARNRRPVLEGDNWWRGHAAAFLKYVNLSPEAIRRGRVSQSKREAAYFIVVLHEMKTVVIAVRGTETPEDLLTDGLCKECNLSQDDLDGLINNDQLSLGVRQTVLSTFPHYGHSGIVESARELFMQVDGHPGGKDGSSSERTGFLSSLLGNGCECHGYKLRIVGHSLGGAVATLLGLRLYGRYPNLRVYGYGSLPCVDSVIAEACSDFVTSIVYNDEFSARLSVNSILRLRAAAIGALSDDSSANSAIVSKLTRRILHRKKYEKNIENQSPSSAQPSHELGEEENHNHKRRPLKHAIKGGVFLCGHAVSCMMNTPDHHASSKVMDDSALESGGVSGKREYDVERHQELYGGKSPAYDDSDSDIAKEDINDYNNLVYLKNGFYESSEKCNQKFLESSGDLLSFGVQESPFVGDSPERIEMSSWDSSEVFLAGLIIHIIPEEKSSSPLWKSWKVDDKVGGYKTFIAKRENFKDIVVSPYMFLDHLPWRCHYALQKVLQTRKFEDQLSPNSLNGDNFV